MTPPGASKRAQAPAPARLSREAAKALTRARLLDAAAAAFAEHGFAGASVDEIAGRAGYTIGALYTHFPGKDELFLSLLAEHISDKISAPQPSTVLLELEFLRYALAHPEVRGRLGTRWERRRASVGRVPPEPAHREADERLARVILAVLDGLAMQRGVDRDAVPAELSADAVRWIVKGFDHG